MKNWEQKMQERKIRIMKVALVAGIIGGGIVIFELWKIINLLK